MKRKRTKEGGNGAAEAVVGGRGRGRGGAGLFWTDEEGNFRPPPFTNKAIGGVPSSYLWYYPPGGGIRVVIVDCPMFDLPGHTKPSRDPDAGARADREAPEAKRFPSAAQSVSAAAAAAAPPPRARPPPVYSY